ncbi:MAG TPA: hypothetical protein PLW24_21585 [Burkholderiaceae bacterium]|nr:hypothetical protein [Burkholderiaceae bacterium]
MFNCRVNKKDDLPVPLSFFQGLSLDDPGSCRELVESIASRFGFKKIPKISFDEMQQSIWSALDRIIPKDVSCTTSDEYGLIDLKVVIDAGFKELTSIIEIVGVETAALGTDANEFSEQVNLIDTNDSKGLHEVQRIAHELSDKINRRATKISEATESYSEISRKTFSRMVDLMRLQSASGPEWKADYADIVMIVSSIRDSAQEARGQFVAVAESMANVPRIERQLRISLLDGANVIRLFIKATDQSIASMNEVCAVAKSLQTSSN